MTNESRVLLSIELLRMVLKDRIYRSMNLIAITSENAALRR